MNDSKSTYSSKLALRPQVTNLRVTPQKIQEARDAVNNSAVGTGFKKLWNQRHRRILSQVLDNIGDNTNMVDNPEIQNKNQDCITKDFKVDQSRSLSVSSPTDEYKTNSECQRASIFSCEVKVAISADENESHALSSQISVCQKTLPISDTHKTNFKTNSVVGSMGMAEEVTFPQDSKTLYSKARVAEKPKKLNKSLKEVIKEVNINFINTFEEAYTNENPKTTTLAPELAKIYTENKRIPKNYKRAFELLHASSLSESKLILMKLAFKVEAFSDVFYYSEFLKISK